MNIHDLNTSITDMSEEQLNDRIRFLRGERRKSDKPLRKVKAKKPARQTKNLRTAIATMSAAEKLELLTALEG